MTREQAIEIEFKSAVGWASHMPETEIRRAAAETIDCYVALGMLKLDEPKPPSAWDKFRDAVIGYDSDSRDLTLLDADCLAMRIDRAGLQIVEK